MESGFALHDKLIEIIIGGLLQYIRYDICNIICKVVHRKKSAVCIFDHFAL